MLVEDDRAKVTDFGMSRAMSTASKTPQEAGTTQEAGGSKTHTVELPGSGLAVEVPRLTHTPSNEVMTATGIGTVQWLAPEIVANEVDKSRKYDNVRGDARGRQTAIQSFYVFEQQHMHVEYSQLVDVYAFAIIMW